MPGPSNTLLIEGPFEELAEELAQYIDNVKPGGAGDDEAATLQAEVSRLLDQNQKDDALKRLVTASAVLNAAPEKEFIAAYNLLVHLIRQSPNLNMFLPKVCNNLSNPVTSSTSSNGPGMALAILTTIFNVMQPDNDTRYHVFLAILSVVKRSGLYESLRPQLKNMDRWIGEWEADEDEQRKLFLEIADVAEEAGEEEESYLYLLRALRTLTPDESTEASAQALALRALRSGLSHPAHFDFHDLADLDAIQALRRSSPQHYELLEIFTAKVLDDYEDFVSEYPAFLDKESLSSGVLHRKMRLLTLASLAATTPSRSLPYASIAAALQIEEAEVEVWVIDVIRAGLVEGKLSQLGREFLVHRSTYRVFGERQWREVASRLETWRESLRGVLEVIRAEREHVEAAREREETGGHGRGGGMAGGRRPGREVDVGLD
ncbi:MAG: hypothetical protein M1832_004090 [Thelocarpon impressellum]|nr:MAG: hypothetical protein M1832_004090 [Thelocarpon impressellum]